MDVTRKASHDLRYAYVITQTTRVMTPMTETKINNGFKKAKRELA